MGSVGGTERSIARNAVRGAPSIVEYHVSTLGMHMTLGLCRLTSTKRRTMTCSALWPMD